jgi:arylsulfatase
MLVVLGLLSVVLAVGLLRDHLAPGVAQIDIETPMHYFIPRANQDIDFLSCDFTRDLDRQTSHNLWSLPLQPCSLVSGWTNPGATGVMASRNRSMLSFFTDSTDWTHVVLRVKAASHPVDDRVQTMSIRLNRHELGSVKVSTEWTSISVEIPPGVVREGVNNVSLRFAYRVPHGAANRRKSVRPLFAINLREIALTKSSGRWGARFGALLQRLVRIDPRLSAVPATQVYDGKLQRYVVSQAGTLVMPVSLSDHADLLEIEILSSKADSSRGGQIILNLQGTASGRVVSQQFPAFEEHGSGSVRGEIRVASLAGETCILWLDIEGETDEVALEITAPRIIERHATVEDRRKKQPRAQADHEPPDIVLITLDAARPHHFSCYGYDRPTTPNIDRLAAESLIFTNAFALVPNTRRSVPTMITGLSFLNHQVIGSDSTLSEAATTIAEHLVDAGYRTACFSASPNNSRVNGDDQGYEEFFELWNEVPRSRSRNPHYLSARVLDWLTSVDDSRPLHLQLHFVPPHAPYAPAPEFDLFSDPLYDGRRDGSPDTILGIDKGGLSFNAADMKQLIALYDGNLRAADDAVEEVLSALRQRPRWKDTVVLVTADHGEAFYEHRRMGHNNTVYDEMLRVPFILRLPGETNHEKFDLDRLVTLADIAPTLLATVPRQPNAHFDGIDVVNTTRVQHGTDNRFFVARTGHETPIRGIRTRRFKAILANSGQGELYDLVNDPGEQRNLRFSSPEVFVGLGLILTRTLLEPPSLSGGVRISEVPESDREMLEALGYVE